MSRTDKIIILQGVGSTLQVLNAGIAAVTRNAIIALCIGAACAGFQMVLQKLGNESLPDPPNAKAAKSPE